MENAQFFQSLKERIKSEMNITRQKTSKKSKIQKNWCTVTVAPTIEHHGGHSRTPANRGETRCPGGVSVSCLASRTRHECPRHNGSVYMEAWHWMWTDTLYQNHSLHADNTRNIHIYSAMFNECSAICRSSNGHEFQSHARNQGQHETTGRNSDKLK